ncbi:MAG: hypothetical protein U0903_13325 [Planctomycetales bacterium]
MSDAPKKKNTVKTSSPESNPALLWGGGIALFCLGIPLLLILVNPLTGVSSVQRQAVRWQGQALLDCGAPGFLQLFIGKDSSFWTYFAGGTQVGVLRLPKTDIKDADLAILGSTPFLRDLDIGETAITDQGLKHLSKVPRLESLNLEKTAVTDEGLESVKELTHLDSLFLTKTKVTAAGLQKLSSLKNLKVLVVDQTPELISAHEQLERSIPTLAPIAKPKS